MKADRQDFQAIHHKIIVLDDDPTGVQTVNHVYVYTDWSIESLEEGFLSKEPLFYILTNSRSFSVEKTREVHGDIARHSAAISKKHDIPFLIISRGDSTLRGHYPLETEVLKETLEAGLDIRFDGEIICPYFGNAGRVTMENVHYITDDQQLIPVGDTEFALDTTFGFSSSHLGKYIEEKTKGRYKKEDCTYIALSDLRSHAMDKLVKQLMEVRWFNKVIVNATTDEELEIFTLALWEALKKGKQFLYRTAASFPKVMGRIENQPYLSREDLTYGDSQLGGIVFVGSHVKKTTEQLNALVEARLAIAMEEFKVHQIYSDGGLTKEIDRLVETLGTNINNKVTTVIYTSRQLIVTPRNRQESALDLSVSISEGLTEIVRRLVVAPRFIIAKGGITSSDIGTKGLLVKKAYVLGQVAAGIPVWLTDNGSKFPGIPYIIFPGNVGTRDSLKELVEHLL